MGRLNINIEEGKPLDLPAAKQKLSILIGVDSFDYIITDENNQIHVFKSYGLKQSISSNSYTEFEDFFRGDRLLNRTYKQCCITSCGPYFTLVPKKLFKPVSAAEYLEQVAELNTKYLAQIDASESSALVNVFGLHSFLQEWCQNRFPNADHQHLISNLFRFAQQSKISEDPNRLYFYKTGNQLAILLIKAHRLHFSNIFQVDTAEQLIYYLGLIFNQFNVSQLDTSVYCLGNLLAGDDFYEVLNQYLSNIQSLHLPTSFSLPGKLSTAPLNFVSIPAVALNK